MTSHITGLAVTKTTIELKLSNTSIIKMMIIVLKRDEGVCHIIHRLYKMYFHEMRKTSNWKQLFPLCGCTTQICLQNKYWYPMIHHYFLCLNFNVFCKRLSKIDAPAASTTLWKCTLTSSDVFTVTSQSRLEDCHCWRLVSRLAGHEAGCDTVILLQQTASI